MSGEELAAQLAGLAISGGTPAAAPPMAAGLALCSSNPAAVPPVDAAIGGKVDAVSGKVAGLGTAMEALRELVGWPVLYAREGRELGVRWPKGLLLHGPPGTRAGCGDVFRKQCVGRAMGRQ